jgi:exosortase/archaeosortase family protein
MYACLGYGVLSFWFAYIIANKGNIFFKVQWILIGFAIINISNMFRIAFILIANYEHWPLHLNIEHHFFYNIISYSLLLLLCIFVSRKLQQVKV